MIPVYQQFVSVSILGPVQIEQTARRTKAQSSFPNGPLKAGEKPVAHEVAGIYTSAVVNTTVAKDNLAAAKAALSRGDLLTADWLLPMFRNVSRFDQTNPICLSKKLAKT
jgi:hypothetical protein